MKAVFSAISGQKLKTVSVIEDVAEKTRSYKMITFWTGFVARKRTSDCLLCSAEMKNRCAYFSGPFEMEPTAFVKTIELHCSPHCHKCLFTCHTHTHTHLM